MKNLRDIPPLSGRLGPPVLLMIAVLLSAANGLAGGLELFATSVKKADLPNDFPFQLLHEGFAVVKVRLENTSGAPIDFTRQQLDFRAPGKKKLKQAEATEIAPKLMKYYQGRLGRVFAEAYSGPRPVNPQQAPTVGVSSSTTAVDASTGNLLRSVLENHQLPEGSLESGSSIEGYIYLRSKKTGSYLSGGIVQLGDTQATIP